MQRDRRSIKRIESIVSGGVFRDHGWPYTQDHHMATVHKSYVYLETGQENSFGATAESRCVFFYHQTNARAHENSTRRKTGAMVRSYQIAAAAVAAAAARVHSLSAYNDFLYVCLFVCLFVCLLLFCVLFISGELFTVPSQVEITT